jgi:hypothetical protein
MNLILGGNVMEASSVEEDGLSVVVVLLLSSWFWIFARSSCIVPVLVTVVAWVSSGIIGGTVPARATNTGWEYC